MKTFNFTSVIGIFALAFLSSPAFSKGAAFQDSIVNLKSKAQVYQYQRNYLEGYYLTLDLNDKVDVIADATGNSVQYFDFIGTGSLMGASAVMNLNQTAWLGFDYQKTEISNKLVDSTDPNNPTESDSSITYLKPFGAFHIGNTVVISAAANMKTSVLTQEGQDDQSGEVTVYEVGALYHGNTWEAGINYKTGDSVEDDPADTEDLEMEEAGSYLVHGRANINGFEVGGSYEMVLASAVDLDDPKEETDYNVMEVQGKYEGFLLGYRMRSANYNDDTNALLKIAQTETATIRAGYDGVIGNLQLGVIYEMISGEETDVDTLANSDIVYTRDGTGIQVSVGYNF